MAKGNKTSELTRQMAETAAAHAAASSKLDVPADVKAAVVDALVSLEAERVSGGGCGITHVCKPNWDKFNELMSTGKVTEDDAHLAAESFTTNTPFRVPVPEACKAAKSLLCGDDSRPAFYYIREVKIDDKGKMTVLFRDELPAAAIVKAKRKNGK